MHVTAGTRRKAVLAIYRAHRKRRGCRLSSAELQGAWKDTGLRRSDLKLALADLAQQHLLLPRQSARGASHELTYLGERAMNAMFGKEPVAGIRDWITLLRARMRRPGRAEALHGLRREGDVSLLAH
jgi:hypothetical protein